MALATECLNLVRREVVLFRDEWINAKENDCREIGMLIRKALYTHDHIIKTDEFYRSMMGEGRFGYDHVVDIKMLSLLVAWQDVSKEIQERAEGLTGDGFDVDHVGRFNRQLENIGWILSPSFSPDVKICWNKLIEMSREGFLNRRYDERQNEWWSNAPTAKPLEALSAQEHDRCGHSWR